MTAPRGYLRVTLFCDLFALKPPPHVVPTTCSAKPTGTKVAKHDVCILNVEWVAALAMCALTVGHPWRKSGERTAALGSFALLRGGARAAYPVASPERLCAVLVALWTVGFGGIVSCDPDAAPQIFSTSHWFEVGWVDTGPNPTQVVNLQPWFDGADKKSVNMSVGLFNAATRFWDIEMSIAVRVDGPRPNPTTSVDTAAHSREPRYQQIGNTRSSHTAQYMHNAVVTQPRITGYNLL